MANNEIGISEAAKKYNLQTASIRFWIKTNKLKAVKKTLGDSKVSQYRIKTAELEKFLTDNGLVSTPAEQASVTNNATPISRKVFDFVQRHPERFASMTFGEVNELIQELES